MHAMEKGWVRIFSKLTQDLRAWGANIRGVVYSISELDLTHPGVDATASTSTCSKILRSRLLMPKMVPSNAKDSK